ncbi:MAG: metal ABC transporter substrate-binding protein [Pseudomonadota bacterium]|nr:metal ABC transporter substrate-binding protein [Pseudomonadota bacterium]
MHAALTVVLLAFAWAMPFGPAVAAEKLKVVATTTDLQALVLAVGGERVEVESIAAPSQDPHSIELKPAQLARLRSAALVVRIGLDHEPWLARAQTDAPVLDVSRGVRLLQAQTPRLRAELEAHVHAYGNTHYWLDPENARPMTAAIAGALMKLRPADRSYFEANRNDFLSRLDGRMKGWTTALAPYHGMKVVVLHDSWAYFADRFGLVIVAAAEPTPGVPPSPAELASLFSRMRQAGVRLVIADPHSSPSLVRQVAERGGARAVTLVPSVGADPAAGDYLSLFEVNVQRLLGALR